MNASLKGVQLRQIAQLLGKTRTGTKAVLIQRIEEALENPKPLAPGTRILSIDLGIRNLAYSLLEIPNANHEPSATKAKKTRKKKNAPTTTSASTPVKPILHAWERLALIPKIPKISKPAAAPKKKAKAKQSKKTKKSQQSDVEFEDDHDESPAEGPTGAEAEAEAVADDKATTPVIIEDFSPARLSAVAVDLILNRLLPLRPDVVTLEQQRFRSMGGSGVYEWTLRVNSLEAMLYAILTTVRTLGRWPGEGRVEAVVARNVLEFMVMQERKGGVEVAGIWGKDADNKKVKKAMVGRMLAAGEGVSVSAEAEPVAREYLDVWNGKLRGKKKSDSFKKLDDMADCLLQGIAFIRWQENTRRLTEGGIEALQDQMVD
ncbi:hypothetical protein VMCG_07470 [Cytospora schulzeri]|uniref:SAP domain-containing protein n=1 Tax=Cytospora schulzeri TaxID=448051 RepID=A0A423W1E3_9PEZI|nr:hypothetical protein VMCG_07470 [Valsa malicola]